MVAFERCTDDACDTSTVHYRQRSGTGQSWSSSTRVSFVSDPYSTPVGIARTDRILVGFQTAEEWTASSDVYVRRSR